uniref:Zinc finger protein 512 n=1 Tax=Sinocyclocheilus anshuiensis TaxID=1608454 RepID=A0A671NX65_9TELE
EAEGSGTKPSKVRPSILNLSYASICQRIRYIFRQLIKLNMISSDFIIAFVLLHFRMMGQQKSSQHTKKESPVYPPGKSYSHADRMKTAQTHFLSIHLWFFTGSQEEKWQLQILAKGRVSCPKCKSVGRKTVDGLKKHLETCKLNPFTCPDCGKQLRTSTGMKYHLMADHNNLGCTGTFTSIMGYVYHMKKCGKEPSELEKLLMNCKHCGKAYRSRAGLEYHLKNEHSPVSPPPLEIEEVKTQKEPIPERTQSGRAKRLSAQVAVFHLKEIASEELLKEWPKRKVQRDLVPDDRKLKYSRPGLPVFSQETLRKWKNEVKLHKKVQCPNKGCNCFYTSVSGLKAHLGLCTLGEFETGKFKCLICKKEFNSESGVKYHINSIHSQVTLSFFILFHFMLFIYHKNIHFRGNQPQEEKRRKADRRKTAMSSAAVTVPAAAAAAVVRAPAASQRPRTQRHTDMTNGPSAGPSRSLCPASNPEVIHKPFLLLFQICSFSNVHLQRLKR